MTTVERKARKARKANFSFAGLAVFAFLVVVNGGRGARMLLLCK
jgi:hypothetical protein